MAKKFHVFPASFAYMDVGEGREQERKLLAGIQGVKQGNNVVATVFHRRDITRRGLLDHQLDSAQKLPLLLTPLIHVDVGEACRNDVLRSVTNLFQRSFIIFRIGAHRCR